MPRPGPRRPQLAVRVDVDTLGRIDRLGARLDVDRSEVVRRLLDAGLEVVERDT